MWQGTLKGKRFCRGVLIGSFTIFLLLLLAPYIVPVVWHATRPGVRRFAGYEIPVPSSFIALQKKDRIDLLRGRITLPPHLYQFELIQIQRSSFGSPIDFGNWMNRAPRVALEEGYSDAKAYEVRIAGTQAACLEDRDNHSNFGQSAFCLTTDGLSIQYIGDKQGLNDMRKMLGSIRRDDGSSR